MSDPFEDEDFSADDEWVEISDIEGRKASLRHLATVHVDNRTYFVLGAIREGNPPQKALMLVREDKTVDGANQYVIAGDEHEIERVVAHVVMNAIEGILANEEPIDDDQDSLCGCRHLPGEFCFCDDPAYLQ